MFFSIFAAYDAISHTGCVNKIYEIRSRRGNGRIS